MTDRSGQRSADAHAFNAASWAVLAGALLAVTLSLALAAYRLDLPSPGWSLNNRSMPGQQFTFSDKLTTGPTPIQRNDVLVAVDGQPIAAIVERALTWNPQPPPGWVAGGTAHYTVRRAGALVTLAVPLVTNASMFALFRSGSELADALVLSIVGGFGLLVFLRRPRDSAARLLFLFCALLPSSAIHTEQWDLFDAPAYWGEALLSALLWTFVIGLLLMHLALVFPVSKPVLRRHARLVPVLLYSLAPSIFLIALVASGDWATAFWPTYNILDPVWSSLGLLVIIASVAHSFLAVRDPLPRAQMRWVALGLLVGLLGPNIILYYLQNWLFPADTWLDSWSHLFVLALPLSLGIAILRYRLWDIDILLNRTLVYGALTLSLVALYMLIVVGFGTLLQAQGNPALALLATALIAVLFAPLRNRVQRGINHLMYGDRDDPYAVLARLGQRLGATLAPTTVLPTIVETVAHALKLPYAAITLKHADGFAWGAAHGQRGGAPLCLPLVYQGELVGQLLLAPRRPGEAFTPAERRLLDDLAPQIGLAVQAVRLTTDLQRSRTQLVTAREEERRRLRRDLHDGLGPQLASLTLKLETARNRVVDPTTDALLVDITTRMQAAVADIRRLVYALRPPALDEFGLVAALREAAAQYSYQDAGGLSIRLAAPDSVPPLPAAVEVAAYRIAQEALTNVVRHARASTCTIRLTLDEPAGVLDLVVEDDGRGLNGRRAAGIGLTSMRERADELGGSCTITTRPPGGTCVWARLPCSMEDTAATRAAAARAAAAAEG
jgi:signal transduction histidine kinase